MRMTSFLKGQQRPAARKTANEKYEHRSKYNPEVCQKIIEIGKTGVRFTEAAKLLGVQRKTLNFWLQKHTDFQEAVRIAYPD